MYIIVVGGGKVGYYLAKTLLNEGHEVLIIEKDKRKCDIISTELGSVVQRGDGTDSTVMEEAGMTRADLAVAVTGDDEDNLMICQMAKKKFDVKRTIARINNPKNERIFKLLGIDHTVSVTDLILAQIEREIPAHSLVHLLTLREVGASFVEAKVPAGSPAVGRVLRELNIPDDCVIPLIIREGKAIVPNGETELLSGDEVVAVTTIAHEDVLENLFAGVTIHSGQTQRG
ncbi:MAG: TrkA family potassium uptake protein [Chloroflexi bacterium]|nr:TrkA family potassium uptake protein [Chloroflexota bacterium]